jgi:2,3-bisphosphoglycerate-independent phosphoglycerate mutase
MKKIIFVVLDGLGDDNIPDFEEKTPLEFANTPNLDKKAEEGALGLLIPTFYGVLPTSEEGHFSLFGYDPEKYGLKRGIITAESVGIEMEKGDVALRGNFATVESGEIKDRRAGRIKNAKEQVEAINGIEIDGIKFVVKEAGEHRVAVVMKGSGLSASITNGDPSYNESGLLEDIKPINSSKEAVFTANVLNKFIVGTHQILNNCLENKKRELPANYLLLRGASVVTDVPSFQEKYGVTSACIAGKSLYKQIGRKLGMEVLSVEGATGFADTDVSAKFETALNAKFDFVFVHIKATDTLAEDGNYIAKKEFIEKIDKSISLFDNFNGILVITSDHSTCSLKKGHCIRPIPFLIWGREKDNTKRFSEKECETGSLGKIEQVKMIEKINLFHP